MPLYSLCYLFMNTIIGARKMRKMMMIDRIVQGGWHWKKIIKSYWLIANPSPATIYILLYCLWPHKALDFSEVHTRDTFFEMIRTITHPWRFITWAYLFNLNFTFRQSRNTIKGDVHMELISVRSLRRGTYLWTILKSASRKP